MNIKNIKSEFPIFQQKINGKPLVYLDSANSSQKPKSVIDKISNFYSTEFSNVGRSVHTLAVKATNRFEETRDNIITANCYNSQKEDLQYPLKEEPYRNYELFNTVLIVLMEQRKEIEDLKKRLNDVLA